MLRRRLRLKTKRTSPVSLNIETCLLNSCVFKYTCSLQSSDTNNERSKGPIHYPVFPSLAVDTQHGFGNNKLKQLISLILQRISNDYAKTLLSGHVAY